MVTIAGSGSQSHVKNMKVFQQIDMWMWMKQTTDSNQPEPCKHQRNKLKVEMCYNM
jgi:hypothetical protein